MPCEFVTNFDAKYPVILGGLLSSEDKMGFIQVSSPHSSLLIDSLGRNLDEKTVFPQLLPVCHITSRCCLVE